MYKERVMNVCLHFTCRIKARCLFLIIPELYMAFWRKQIRVWFESSGSQTRVLFAKSTLFPKLIRTWFEQDSNKCLKKYLKRSENQKMISVISDFYSVTITLINSSFCQNNFQFPSSKLHLPTPNKFS